MDTKDKAPAIEQGAQSNLSKDTNIVGNTQILKASISVLEKEIKNKESLLKQRRQEQRQGKSHQRVLADLLNQIKTVNYREEAKLEGNEKIGRKQYAVITIDKILETALTHNWGICTRNGFIYVYNAKQWHTIGVDDFKSFLGIAALKMGVPILEAKYHLFRDELFKQFMASANLPTPEPKEQTLINLQNGTFEIIEVGVQKIREHRADDFLTYLLPFAYEPEAKCPLFMQYLNKVMPDEDCQKILAEFIGYVFTRNLKLEKALILYGSGANGKSVFFEIVSALLGEHNISSYSLQSLTKMDSYQRAELQNKLLNYAPEISNKQEAAISKQLISGEAVEARQIYGKPFIMKNYAKLMFNCNELPKDVEHTNAFFRRFIIIPFKVTIPDHEQDTELPKKIIESELSGVFNWVLAGLQRILQQRKFTNSSVVNEEIKSYKKESDSVAMFLDEENYSPTMGNPYTYLKVMYNEYREFCNCNGYKTCSIKTLSDRLRTLGFTIEKTRDGRIVFARK